VLANAEEAAISFLVLSLSPLHLYKIPASAEEKLALFLGYGVGQIVPQTFMSMPSKSARALSSIRAAITNPPSVSRELRGGVLRRSGGKVNRRFSFIRSFLLQICDDSKEQHFEYRV
jgi:hypothetical protein